MIIEIDDNEPLAAQIRTLQDVTSNAQRRAQRHFNGLPEDIREAHWLAETVAPQDGDVVKHALSLGVSKLLNKSYPTTVLCLNTSLANRRSYAKDEPLTVVAQLPIGSEIVYASATPSDGTDWEVTSLYLGTYNVLSVCSGSVELAAISHITQADLLGVFAGKETSHDVRVSMSLVCKRDGATFSGYKLFIRHEESKAGIIHRLRDATGSVTPVVK